MKVIKNTLMYASLCCLSFILAFGVARRLTAEEPEVIKKKRQKHDVHEIHETTPLCSSTFEQSSARSDGSITMGELQKAACQQEDFWRGRACQLKEWETCIDLYEQSMNGSERELFSHIVSSMDEICKRDPTFDELIIKAELRLVGIFKQKSQLETAKRCADIALAELGKRCESGEAHACRKAGLFDKKNLSWKEKELALEYRDCTSGKIDGCAEMLPRFADHDSPTASQLDAIQRVGGSCDEGDPKACESRSKFEFNKRTSNHQEWDNKTKAALTGLCSEADIQRCPFLKYLTQNTATDTYVTPPIDGTEFSAGDLVRNWSSGGDYGIPARWLPAWRRQLDGLCEQGNGSACGLRIRLSPFISPFDHDSEEPEDDGKAEGDRPATARFLKFLVQKCQQKREDACEKLAASDDFAPEGERTRAEQILRGIKQDQCRAGTLDSCTTQQEWREQCEKKNPQACVKLADYYAKICKP